jgi:hypothetical protein
MLALAGLASAQSRVPEADSTANRLSQYTVGNKADAATTTVGSTASLVAYIKGLLGLFGALNATTTDCVNGKIGTDTEMNDVSLFDMITTATTNVGTANTAVGTINATTTDSLHGKIGTDTEMNDVSLFDMITTATTNVGTANTAIGTVNATTTDSLNGKLGTDTEMGDNSLWDYLVPKEAAGTTDVDISEAVYTGYVPILTITPASGQGLIDCSVAFDWNKATTGWDDISTASDTLDVIVETRTDATNYRLVANGTQRSATGAGTLAQGADGQVFNLGMVGVTGRVRVSIKLSIERDDCEIPYRVLYRGGTATITPVAAG